MSGGELRPCPLPGWFRKRRSERPSSSNAATRTRASRVLAIPGRASALARRRLTPPSGRRREPPGSNRHRHADERFRRKHSCPNARRLPPTLAPDDGRLLAVGSERPLQAAEMTKASAGVVEAGARMRGKPLVRRPARWRVPRRLCDRAAHARVGDSFPREALPVARPVWPLLLGDSSSQVDRRRSGRGPRSCVGTRSGNRDRSASVPLVAANRSAVSPPARVAASGCRNRTNLAVGRHRQTSLPNTTSASGRRRSSRSVSP